MKKNTIKKTLTITLLSSGIYWLIDMVFHSHEFWYLLPNLLLAMLPLALCFFIKKRGVKKDAITYGVLALWLLFLPNTFYIVTDFVHLGEVGRISGLTYSGSTSQLQVFDVLMLASFTLNGLLLGIFSVLWMKQLLVSKFRRKSVRLFIYFCLGASCFGMYFGRNMRLNSWELFIHPFHIIKTIVSILFSPSKWPELFYNAGLYMLFITPFYYMAEQLDGPR